MQDASPLLLFLDFDGVLHARSAQSPFQTSCMNALASRLTEYPIEIVIASTWRESQLMTHQDSTLILPQSIGLIL